MNNLLDDDEFDIGNFDDEEEILPSDKASNPSPGRQISPLSNFSPSMPPLPTPIGSKPSEEPYKKPQPVGMNEQKIPKPIEEQPKPKPINPLRNQDTGVLPYNAQDSFNDDDEGIDPDKHNYGLIRSIEKLPEMNVEPLTIDATMHQMQQNEMAHIETALMAVTLGYKNVTKIKDVCDLAKATTALINARRGILQPKKAGRPTKSKPNIIDVE